MSRVHYNDEMRLQTVKLVLKGEKSATKIAKDIGVNPNIVDMTSLLANGHDRGVRNTPVFLLPVVKTRDEKK